MIVKATPLGWGHLVMGDFRVRNMGECNSDRVCLWGGGRKVTVMVSLVKARDHPGI